MTNKQRVYIDADLLTTMEKKLLQIEAWAAGLQEECYKTRMLIQAAGGSPLAKDQSALSERQLAELSARRKARIFKNTRKGNGK